ncbi:hypothetical protein RhiirA4_333013, partial [Rhizophagus irregularis]
YADIIIDEEALQSLPENCSIADHLPQIENDQLNKDSSENENGNDNMITRIFVPYLPPSHCEDHAIKSALNHIQTENPPITWPQIDNSPINEFQTPGYIITMAFPTLYPTVKADLGTERIRDIKPAEYFKHLLRYKDGRFRRHTHWRYFALNSQM